ncbi:phospholysine phosphohistidine inorganic pyrophosphate phosphatase-like [Clytia hemisphaerica]|uniref:phospholysine phosphohistidine inorganic pyrophosphate phosphatase-like n=1 Tax=Clytia hemisphaerica TaxID=252671 RepID=UPI0034D55FFD
MSRASWLTRPIKGVLLDITGVIYNTTTTDVLPITGSVEAIKRLKDASIPIRFCTNETQLSQQKIFERLQSIGIPLEVNQVFSPVPAAQKYLQQHNLRPYVIVHEKVKGEFNHFKPENDPDCVLIGDATDNFSYQNMDEAFRVLLKNPKLIAMGYGRYYKENDDLYLDVGSYSKVLEFATGVEPIIIGKPSKTYFTMAVQDMGLKNEECIMVGDDIFGDVEGAQKAGLRGLQVRTGKYRPSDEPHPQVKPDGYVDNLAQAVDLLLNHQQ